MNVEYLNIGNIGVVCIVSIYSVCFVHTIIWLSHSFVLVSLCFKVIELILINNNGILNMHCH